MSTAREVIAARLSNVGFTGEGFADFILAALADAGYRIVPAGVAEATVETLWDAIMDGIPARDAPAATGDWLVWSNEHGAWWRPNSAGYTQHLSSAGRYTKTEADAICRDGGYQRAWSDAEGPYEVALLAPSLPAPPAKQGG